MPKREVITGAPVWIDLMSSDTDKSRAFYGELFRWTGEPDNPEMGGYSNFSKDGARIAGLMPVMPNSPPNVWTVYLAVDDAKETTDRAEANGGTVLAPAMDVQDLGTMAVVTDAGGAAIGMWKPGTHRGIGIDDEPGAPAWFELHTRDYDASIRFYEQVFGWTTRVEGDSPEFRYSTLIAPDGETQLAGVMDASSFLPEGMPAHWAIYFDTADADATIAKAIELGGATVQAAEDTPYGRLATLADSTGALFKLRQKN